MGIEAAVLLRTMIPPVAEPPGAVDRVMMTSSEIVPFITDTLTVTPPASSRTEYVVWLNPMVAGTEEKE